MSGFALLLIGGTAAADAFCVVPDGWRKKAGKETGTAVQVKPAATSK